MNDGLIEIVNHNIEDAGIIDSPLIQQKEEDEIYKRKIAVIEAEIEDNCIEHGVRGILEHDHILNMISEYNDEDKQARIFGKFQHLTGLVYKSFNRRIHVIEPFQVKDEDFVTVQLMDCHPRNEDAFIWIAVDKYGRHFAVDELYKNFDGNLDAMASVIKKRDNQYRMIQWRADPSAWNEDQHKPGQKSLAKEMHDRGISYVPGSKSRSMGIQLTKNALHYQAQEINGEVRFLKPPILYIFNTCERTIWEFEHWQYNEYSGKSAERKDKSEKPQDKDDHMLENIGRAFLNPIVFTPMPKYVEYASDGIIPQLDPYENINE